MIISRIILKNWRNFKKIDVALKERIFVVGPNASGKSNFLDAFRFLRDIAKSGGGLQKAISDRGGISKIRCLAARKDPEIVIRVDISEYNSNEAIWRYEIGIKQESRGNHQPYLSFERVWGKDGLDIQRPNREDKNDKERLSQTFLEQINSNQEFRDIAKYFEKTLYLHLVPQLLKYPNAFSGVDLPGDPFGKGFLERLAKTPEKKRGEWLKKIDSALRIAVPQLKELHYKRDEENGKPHIEAVYEHWRPDAGKQNEEQFSDGTLRMIGLLWALQEGDGLLLLEEPELSLNAAIIAKLPEIIYKIQKPRKRQVIMTTHSADLLQEGISLQEILMLKPESEGTDITPASNNDEIKAMLDGGMTPAEAILPKTAPKNISQMSLGF